MSASPSNELSALGVDVQAALSAHGALAHCGAGWRSRDEQLHMAQAVTQAIEAREGLVVEAGTGVGKTYAYLVPVLLSSRRTLLSTATKALQDQLFLRDLPRLREALRVPARVALLKGRGSYLCLHRLALARQEDATFADRGSARALALVERWSQATATGDLGELEGLDERSPLIPQITSTRDNCLGSECPSFSRCHVMRARREAMDADVVVVNHHLFFADLSLRDSGVAELLPTVDVLVFDEAHQIVETGVQFLGRTLATAQIVDFVGDFRTAGLTLARGLAPWVELAGACEQAARDLRLAAGGTRDAAAARGKRRWEAVQGAPAFAAALAGVAASLQAAAEAADHVADAAPDFARLAERARELATRATGFAEPAPPGQIRWIDLGVHHARLVQSPLDIRQRMGEARAAMPKTWIFTSATLGDEAGMGWFTGPAGLDDLRQLRLASPFDYPAHARVWVPETMPLPADGRHPAAVAEVAAACAQVLGGRTFVLTTTLRAMGTIAEALARQLGPGIAVWCQGTAPKRQLMNDFLHRGGVLVGSHSFWEGIDVPGEALQCVVIDKLPFPPPDDPLVEARARALRAAGRDAFAEQHLPETAVGLRQGAGRLIRHESDRGLLVLCDPRLRRMSYGRRLMAALPPMTPVATREEALAWLAQVREGV